MPANYHELRQYHYYHVPMAFCFVMALHMASSSIFLCQVHAFSVTSLSTQTKRSTHHSSRLFGVAQTSSTQTTTKTDDTMVQVRDLVGSGSYGTVHLLTLEGENNNDNNDRTTTWYIGKRAWTEAELLENINATTTTTTATAKKKEWKEKAARCQYYWQVENHCFEKLPPHPQLPPFIGTRTLEKTNEWMVFALVGDNSSSEDDHGNSIPKPAPTLGDLMKLDYMNHHDHQQDFPEDTDDDMDMGDDDDDMSLGLLQNVGTALGCSSFGETLDRVLQSLLGVLVHIHDHQIVHRDIKPQNLLVHNETLILIDFGSAADLDPISNGGGGVLGGLMKKRWGLENGDNIAAVSPIYAAPEIFIDIQDHPLAFDIFSSGLLFCQLLFSYLEERTDAGFHQQLQEADWDLNLWLNNEMGSKLRPKGLTSALKYLAERPGLWTLLGAMLAERPSERPTSQAALTRLRKIITNYQEGSEDVDDEERFQDGPFFTMVIESLELCEIPTASRPLHFVATFNRRQPLGLVLSEVDGDNDDDDGDVNPLWKETTKDAAPGDVFVKEVVEGGQADELGVFEVGDRLQGVGELVFLGGGFEKAVEMLQDQPRNAQYVRLHFDRIRVKQNQAISMVPSDGVNIHVQDFGAWSAKGKRKANEDKFVLHEIHDTQEHSVLLAGVFDGHGGTAASTKVANDLPGILSKQLLVDRQRLSDSLTNSWDDVCRSYRQLCMDEEVCPAEYDAREGVLLANTGSEDLIPGTTASMLALDEKSGKLSSLNCGDSRSLMISPTGSVLYATSDHTPQTEEARLREGIKAGLDYSMPKCRLSKWSIRVGDYVYSVGRSLEGPLATSKGLVSDPDISTVAAIPGASLLSATDGLWEVMDSEEVGLDIMKMRRQGMSAKDAARALCSMALRKGSSDNVSAVLVYLAENDDNDQSPE